MRVAHRWPALLLLVSGAGPSCDQGTTVTTPPSVCDVALDLADAIAAASDAVPGTVIEAEIEIEDGEALYDIDIVTDAGVSEIAVDPETGEVEVDEDQPEPEDYDAAAVLETSPTSLIDAIAIAEQEASGCAVLVEVEPETSLIKVVIQADGEAAVAVKIRTEDGMVMGVGEPEPDDD